VSCQATSDEVSLTKPEVTEGASSTPSIGTDTKLTVVTPISADVDACGFTASATGGTMLIRSHPDVVA